MLSQSTGRPLWAFLEKDPALRRSSGGIKHSWPERANQVHTRDILFIGEISSVVDRLLEEKERVSIFSGQAGMVTYYLAKQFYGRVEFVDRFGLSTQHFMAFKKEVGLRAKSWGLEFPMEVYFAEGRSRSGVQWSPDVTFGIYERIWRLWEENGYRQVFEQTGSGAPYLERQGACRPSG